MSKKKSKMEKSEVRAVIKYLRLKGMTPQEVHADMQQTLGDSAPAYSTVVKWCAEFKRGRASCEDADRSGRPSTSVSEETIGKVRDLVMNDRRLTVRCISESVGISYGSIHSILTDHLKLRKVSARWVPRMLTDEQKASRLRTSTALLEQFRQNPEDFLSRFITMDETWVHHFDPETKQQSMAWKHSTSPPPKKFRVAASAGKVMASVFWDAEGVVLVDYLERGASITGNYYAQLIGKLRQAIKDKRRGKLRRRVLFHQDNAPVHKSSVAMAAIRDAGFEVLEHPPYSPDLAPSDFYLFPKLKEHLRGQKFSSNQDVMSAVNTWLEDQNKEFFSTGIRALEHRWTKCISVQGDYVEK
jgi:histone-lysine N-methyltransferase SETMAR